MLATPRRPRLVQGRLVLLGLLVVLSGSACNGGPTRPSDADRIALYKGRWSTSINGFEVVLDMTATREDLVGISGAGTAHNAATGETYPLRVLGFGTLSDEHGTAHLIVWANPEQNLLGLTGGQEVGDFRGNVSINGRTWPGRWTPTNNPDGVAIFGPGERALTLIKN